MAWVITGVAVSDVTRYLSDDPRGTLSAEVTFDLQDGEPGPGSRISIDVDLQDASELSFAEIESRSLRIALDVLYVAASSKIDTLESSFRAKFVDHSKESPAG